MMLTVVISTLVLLIVVYMTIKEACFVSRIVEWNVGTQKRDRKDVSSMSGDSSVTALQPSDIANQDDLPNPEDIPEVLVLPRRIKINGRNVELPDIHPTMNPVLGNGGETIGYYTRQPAFTTDRNL
jgi:hypothetical protein